MTGPSPTTPQQSGTAHPLDVIYAAMCGERLWASHYDIPDSPSEERPVDNPPVTLVYAEGQPVPESERSPFAADEDPEPLSHMGAEEA